MDAVLGNKLVEAAQIVEQQLDAELNRLDNLDEDELEKIRERRVHAMKKAQAQKQVGFFTFYINFVRNLLSFVFTEKYLRKYF